VAGGGTGTVTNSPTVSANETDPNPANNTASTSITISNASVCTGATILWTGTAGDGLWNTAANWNPNRLPASTDIVCIDTQSSSSTFILATTSATIKQLIAQSTIVASGTSLTINGTVASNFASNVTLTGGTIAVTPGAAVNGTLTSSGTSAFGGTSASLIING